MWAVFYFSSSTFLSIGIIFYKSHFLFLVRQTLQWMVFGIRHSFKQFYAVFPLYVVTASSLQWEQKEIQTYLSNMRKSSANSSSDFPLLSSFMQRTIITKNSSKSTVPLPAGRGSHLYRLLYILQTHIFLDMMSKLSWMAGR